MDDYDLNELQRRLEELKQSTAEAKRKHTKPIAPIVIMGLCYIIGFAFLSIGLPGQGIPELAWALPVALVLIFIGLMMLVLLFVIIAKNKPINELVNKNNAEMREIQQQIAIIRQAERGGEPAAPAPTPVASGPVLGTAVNTANVNQLSETGDQLVYKHIDGAQKTLDVYEDRIVLTQIKNFRSFMTQDLFKGSKEIYFADMTSIQFKQASSMIFGYIQFEVPGIQSTNNFQSENSWTYDTSKQAIANEIAAYVKKRISEIKRAKAGGGATVVQNQVSAADEIAKFKKLLDDGVITQEEFDSKKKQLLGL